MNFQKNAKTQSASKQHKGLVYQYVGGSKKNSFWRKFFLEKTVFVNIYPL